MTTPPIIAPTIPNEPNIKSPSRPISYISAVTNLTSFKVPQPITVMLKGLTLNAIVSIDVYKKEISALGQANARLIDDEYTLNIDFSDFIINHNFTLNAICLGSNVSITLNLADQGMHYLSQKKIISDLTVPQNLSYNEFTSGTLAEKGHTWTGRPSQNSAAKRAKKSLYGSAGCMVIPSNTVLNLRALVKAFDRLSTQQIENGIQELIDLLDYRNGDPDLEVDADSEPEIEEGSVQLI